MNQYNIITITNSNLLILINIIASYCQSMCKTKVFPNVLRLSAWWQWTSCSGKCSNSTWSSTCSDFFLTSVLVSVVHLWQITGTMWAAQRHALLSSHEDVFKCSLVQHVSLSTFYSAFFSTFLFDNLLGFSQDLLRDAAFWTGHLELATLSVPGTWQFAIHEITNKGRRSPWRERRTIRSSCQSRYMVMTLLWGGKFVGRILRLAGHIDYDEI